MGLINKFPKLRKIASSSIEESVKSKLLERGYICLAKISRGLEVL